LEWLQLAVEENKVNPTLLGPDLYKYYGKSRKGNVPAYMVLLADDHQGDLRYEQTKFFGSLQKHEYDKSTHQVKFDCGIVLNVQQVITGCEEIEMTDLRLLFTKKKLRTACCFWVNELKLRPIRRPVGVGGEITRLKNIAPICCLRLKPPALPIQQLVFRQDAPPALVRIYRDGERYPSGKIHGWKVVE
jgi:hypothetical protein